MPARAALLARVAAAHETLLRVLRDGCDGEAEISCAKAAGETVLPALAGFYDAIVGRRADFTACASAASG